MPSRYLKESICTSDNLNNLTPDEERFFYRILVKCEDYGRMDARPAVLRSQCFPIKLDDEGNFTIKLTEIVNWLVSMVKNDLIVIYLHNSRPYLQMVTWGDHNQIRNIKPKFPGIEEEGSQVLEIDNICKHLLSIDNFNKHERSDSYTYTRSNTNTITRSKSNKIKYAEFVNMTPEEYQKLVDKFGETGTKDKIEALNLWKGSKGKKTASDYMTILNWARRDGSDKKDPESLSNEPDISDEQRKFFEQFGDK